MRARTFVATFLGSAMLVGSAWAGIGLAPVGTGAEKPVGPSPVGAQRSGGAAGGVGAASDTPADSVVLGADELHVGASKVNLYPQPDASKNEVWVRDKKACLPAGSGGVDPALASQHVHDWRTPWVENTNCLYMGGFGIGPSQPILDFDQTYGLWVRTVVLERGGKTLVLTLLDAEGYNAVYNKLCPPERACGANDIAKQMGAELGFDPAGVVIASTHAHSGMDLIGGWGGVPTWYMRQVAESIRQSIREAMANRRPATLEAGDTLARRLNSERRDTYHSAEDPTLNWFRAVGRDGQAIATVGAFAAHATSFGSSATIAHADWPGVFAKSVEDRFGGLGIAFEAGLGNMSARNNNKGSMGAALAALLPELGGGIPVPNPEVRVAQAFWNQPVTNGPLAGLGGGGFFDRPFQSEPGAVQVGKQGNRKPCTSTSPVSVRTSVTAAKVGDMVVAAAPGEIFANYSNTIEEQSPITALSIAQANDALGYLPQAFENDDTARQGGGFVGQGVFEYEDAYSIDRCFGEASLIKTLDLLAGL